MTTKPTTTQRFTCVCSTQGTGACLAQAELPPECQTDECGHVDTDATSMSDHGYMTPHDMDALLDALQHALGFRTGPGNCSVCYYATELADALTQAVTAEEAHYVTHDGWVQ